MSNSDQPTDFEQALMAIQDLAFFEIASGNETSTVNIIMTIATKALDHARKQETK